MTPYQFAAHYREHQRKLYCFVLSLSRSREQAEDVTARAFAKAWEYRGQLNGNFKPWLYQIAINELKTDWRRASYIVMEPLTADHREIPAPYDPAPAMRQECADAIAAVSRLTATMREALADAIHGVSLQQSAKAQGVPYGTAGRRLCEARQKMRELCQV